MEPFGRLFAATNSHFSRDSRDVNTEDLTNVLISLTGSQIESEELLCCIFLPVPGRLTNLSKYGTLIIPPRNFPKNFVHRWHPGDRSHFAQDIRKIRECLANFRLSAPLIGILDNKGQIDRLLMLRESTPLTELAKEGDVFEIRPRHTLRIYRDGELKCQILRLRDGTGWVVRTVADYMISFRRSFGPVMESISLERLVLDSALLASEQAHGFSIFVLACPPAEYYQNRDNQDGAVSRSIELGRPFLVNSPSELLRFAFVDGGTILDDLGQVLDYGVYFRSPGGRHDSASFAVRSIPWILGAVIVSQDGPISWIAKDGPSRIGGDLVRYL